MFQGQAQAVICDTLASSKVLTQEALLLNRTQALESAFQPSGRKYAKDRTRINIK